jgi:hypothetical protein
MIVKNRMVNAVLWALLYVIKALSFITICVVIGCFMCFYLGNWATGVIGTLGLIIVIAIDRYKNNKE